MGITGLLPFIEKASRRVNVGEFNGCTVAIDSYCWLHKGAFACADKLVRGEETDVHIKYCLKYVNMLLSKNVKPILVFDGRHLPAKALTESKRRETRNSSKKRAAELLKLGKIEEARSYMRRSVDITHEMALQLIRECRKRNVDCIVAPYEADAQLAYLNIRNIAHVVITEDSDLILFGCTKVLFKMDLEGFGTLVETEKLPLVMKCPIEHYTFDKFRQMCIMSGCDYLASLPGIGLAKARQFVTATQDSNFANALRKLPGFFNRANLQVTDEYRENFLKAEATFKHQYVYDPIDRKMVRLTDPDSDDIEDALCVNAGEILDPKVAFQLALGNLDPFTLKKMDDWHPDHRIEDRRIKTERWKDTISSHPSIWSPTFEQYLTEASPWAKKVKKPDPVFGIHSKPRKVVNLVAKYVPETQDDSLSIETLSNMYCLEPSNKRQKTEEIEPTDSTNHSTNKPKKSPSPILENKERSFKKILKNGSYSVLKRLSKFPRTVIGDNIVESKFFSTSNSTENPDIITIEDSPKKTAKAEIDSGIDTQITEYDSQENSQKENSPVKRNRIIRANSADEINSPVKIKSFDVNGYSEINNATKRNRPVLDNSADDINSPVKINSVEVNGCSEINSATKKNRPVLDNSPNEINSTNAHSYKKTNNPFKKNTTEDQSDINSTAKHSLIEANSANEINSPVNKKSPILEPSPRSRNPFRRIDFVSEDKLSGDCLSQESVIENTEVFESPSNSQEPIRPTPPKPSFFRRSPTINSSQPFSSQTKLNLNVKRSTCKVPGLKRTNSLPSNQPTLLSKFGFQKKPILKR